MAGTPFQDIKYSDVSVQGRGERDTYARKYGYPGWQEMEAAGGANLALGPQFQAGPSSSELLAKQTAEEEKLFGQFETIRAGQEKLPSLYERLKAESPIAETSAQLKTARTEVAKVKDLLDRLEEDINTTVVGTGVGLVSEAQRRRIIAGSEAPLRTQLGRLLTGQEVAAGELGTAQQEVGQQFQLQTAQQERELEPTKMRIAAFSDRAARELTAYTNDRQNELNIYLQKLQIEGQLSLAEMNKASDLAKQEQQYVLEAKRITQQMEADVQKAIRTKGIGTTGTATTFGTTSLAGKPTTAPSSASFGGFDYSSWANLKF